MAEVDQEQGASRELSPATSGARASKGAHTPGPWRVELRENYQGCTDLTGAWIVTEAVMVAEVRGAVALSGAPLPEHLANARLIAAAPELLEACREAAKAFRMYEEMHAAKGTVEGVQKAVANASRARTCEAAIRKATEA